MKSITGMVAGLSLAKMAADVMQRDAEAERHYRQAARVSRVGTSPVHEHRTLYTIHKTIGTSRYSGADVRRLGAERGVGRPPAVLAARAAAKAADLARDGQQVEGRR